MERNPAGDVPAESSKRRTYVPVVRCSLVRERKQEVPVRRIRCPSDVALILADYLDGADREHFVALLLDAKNAVIAIHTVSVGSLSEAIVHPRETYKAAVLAGAAGIILGHNHPSGDPTPSGTDIATSHRLVECGKLLGIEVLDHVIIGEGSHVSLKEKGLL